MTAKAFDITGIGNACMDIVAQCDESFLMRHEIEKSHCVYLDHAALERIKAEIGVYALVPGGSAANTVHCFHALGGDAAFLGRVAADAEGDAFGAAMRTIGIDCRLSHETAKDIGSTQVICLTTPDGDRSFATYQGVAETIAPEHLDYTAVAQSKIVYFDGYTMYSPFALAAFLKAAETARTTGGLSVFNPGDLSIPRLHGAAVAEIVDAVDIVICNLAEARQMLGVENLDDAERYLRERKRAGAVTDGANGAAVFRDGKSLRLPPASGNLKVLDTNGAGDHFAAGFLFGMIRNFSLQRAGRLATLCALDCLSHNGARPLGRLDHLVERSAIAA